MENKIWFITGASSGFGKEFALAVIKKGGKVIATFREQEQLDEFENIDKQLAFGYLLDVTDFPSVNEVIKQIFHRFERVDVGVNAAGQGFAGVVEEANS